MGTKMGQDYVFRSESEEIAAWLLSSARKPLLMRGARQVGKSTLVRECAERLGFQLAEINLENHLSLKQHFLETSDTSLVIREIEVLTQKSILQNKSKTLLFIDEIQAIPEAISALRYLYEQHPELPVVAAGSLLEFVLKDIPHGMPVGRIQYFYLGPIQFRDYLKNYSEDSLLEAVMEGSFSAHEKLLKRLREYFIVGGMPEAVSTYKKTLSLKEVDLVHSDLIQTYQDDFAKYADARIWARMQKILQWVPRNVGRKVIFASISPDEGSREMRLALEKLIQAKLIYPVCHVDANGVPLAAEKDDRVFKPLFLDIGMMTSLLGLRSTGAANDLLWVNEGALAEQFVGQQLLYRHGGRIQPELYYWLREKKQSNAEVDYVVSEGSRVIPIEVKAGKAGSLRSLHQLMMSRPQIHQALRLDTRLPHVQRVNSYELRSLPLYFAGVGARWNHGE